MNQIILDSGTLHLFGLSVPLRVYGYGLMLVLGFLLSIYVAQRIARRCGENPEHIARVGLLSLVGGIVGSRAAYIFQHWDRQFADAPLGAMFDVTSGGLIYYGGVVLATALVLAYLLIQRLPIRRYLDIVAVPLMIGLAFGRAGCTLNGCCYGAPCRTDWPAGMRFPLYSKPLVKLDGRENPFSRDTVSPSPVYAHQLARGRVQPPAELVNWAIEDLEKPRVVRGGEFVPRRYVLPAWDLHGELSGDQTATWSLDPGELRKRFFAAAGRDRLMDAEEFAAARRRASGPMLGSEHWAEARLYDSDAGGKLTFEEFAAYLAWRRDHFDADGDGTISPGERDEANALLRADQIAIASAERSLPVKPAQPLGIVNALILAALLAGYFRLRGREGNVFALLAVLYPITRFVLESIRDDNAHNVLAGSFTHNQYTSMVLTTIGIGMLLLFRYLPASAGPVARDRAHAPRSPRTQTTR